MQSCSRLFSRLDYTKDWTTESYILENLKVCKNVNIKFRTIQFLFETFFNIFGKQVYYFR